MTAGFVETSEIWAALTLCVHATCGRILAGLWAPFLPKALGWLAGWFLTCALTGQITGLVAWSFGIAFDLRTWLVVSAVGAVAVVLTCRPLSDERPIDPRSGPGDRLPVWILIAGAGAAFVLFRSVLLTSVIGPRSWDGESYHLSVPLQWLGARSLLEPVRVAAALGEGSVVRISQPGNAHLWMLPWLGFGGPIDAVACLSPLPFLFLAAWATRAIARADGATDSASALVAVAFASMPLVIEQATNPMVDLTASALGLASLAVVVARRNSGDRDAIAANRETPDPGRSERRRAALGGLLLGLGLGSKATAWLVAPVAAVAVPAAFAGGVLRRGWRGSALATFAAAAIAPAFFWWFRAASVLGDPLFPLGPDLASGAFPNRREGGLTPEDLSGYWDLERMGMTSRLDWLVFPLKDPEYSVESGFGFLMALMIYVALGRAALYLLRIGLRLGRGFPKPGAVGLDLMVVALLAGFWFIAARTPRFSIALLGLLAAAAARPLDAALRSRLIRPFGASLFGALVVAASLATAGKATSLIPWTAPRPREARLAEESRAIPAEIDSIRPLVILNDFHGEPSSILANYWLFGADHRHLVYDEGDGPLGEMIDADQFLSRVRALGIEALFLRQSGRAELPARYRSPRLALVGERVSGPFVGRLYLIQSESAPHID